MHHRETVNQHRYVITVGVVATALTCTHLVLVNHLQGVVMGVGLVDQVDIFSRTIIPLEDLNVVFLNPGSFF